MALTKVSSGLISADASSVDLNIDAGTLYIDATNNRVGIGTTSPSAPLNISATYSSDTTEQFRIQDNTGGKLDFFGYANGGKGLQAYADNGSTFYNLNLQPLGGNVGIGTTTPSSLLHIVKPSGNNTYLQIAQAGIESWQIGMASNSSALAFLNSGSERMRIDSSGNVGIGTSNPTSNTLTIIGKYLLLSDSQTKLGDYGIIGGGAADGNSRLEYYAGKYFSITQSGTERMRLDSSGDLQLGSSIGNGTYNGSINAVANKSTGAIIKTRNGDGNKHWMVIGDSNIEYGSIGLTSPTGTGLLQIQGESGTVFTRSGGTEAMRLTSNGEFLLNRTGIFGTGNTCSAFIQGKSTAAMYVIGTNTSGYQLITFFNGGLSVMGSITHNNTSVTYGTSSDYRLKENVVELDGAIDRVKLLQPKRFNFIADAENTVDGFLAHEVADVVPEAITGVKDEMQEEEYEVTPAVLDEDGNVVTEAVMGTREVPKYQNIDQSKLVPLLTKAIQEQQVLIEQLQAEVALLKGE